MIDYPIHIGPDALPSLGAAIRQGGYTQVLVLADDNTHRLCYPLLKPHIPAHSLVQVIGPGEAHKHLGTCVHLWSAMTAAHLDRKALVIDLGGGVIGDMGGFVAATYKRGIAFAQVPTTLLAQVDASVGGKLGIDFEGYKNHIGIFAEPQGVYIDPVFLRTLPDSELRSGFAEVVKHHLIADAAAWEALRQPVPLRQRDFTALVRHSVDIKRRIVASDPYERGPRKALNFGHTLGHALESERLDTGSPLLHGEAVAVGMVCETWLSHRRGLLRSAQLDEVTTFLLDQFPPVAIAEDEMEPICRRTLHDKKNEGGEVRYTLLDGIGGFRVDQPVPMHEAQEALAFYAGCC
ncbi:MAG: 3-dehydroquinate synthase [Bacteroidia bacterium]